MESSPQPLSFNPYDLHMGMKIMATDRSAGSVTAVLINQETGQIVMLVVSPAGFFGHDVVMPVGTVAHIEGETVFVNATQAEVKAFPRYDPASYGSAQGLISRNAIAFDRSVRHKES